MTPATHQEGPAPLGRHLLADLYGVSAPALADELLLERLLLDALRRAGFNVLNCATHKFPGEQAGVTALVLLCESHAAIHTYPELEYLALDIFSCGDTDPYDVLEQLRDQLRPTRVQARCEDRGSMPLAPVRNTHDP
jgi:S-adenosylmethionine decarboxylase